MSGTGVIDQFLNVFTTYIDSGFGLLQGEVKWLAATLIVIDLVLAALFWAWAPDEDVIARLVKKVLFVGVFAFIINNWASLIIWSCGPRFTPIWPPCPGPIRRTSSSPCRSAMRKLKPFSRSLRRLS